MDDIDFYPDCIDCIWSEDYNVDEDSRIKYEGMKHILIENNLWIEPSSG